MELEVGIATAPSWSYAYAGTCRSLVYSIEATARTVAAAFGFKKLAKLIRANIDTAFGHAINAGRIRRVGDDLYPGQ